MKTKTKINILNIISSLLIIAVLVITPTSRSFIINGFKIFILIVVLFIYKKLNKFDSKYKQERIDAAQTEEEKDEIILEYDRKEKLGQILLIIVLLVVVIGIIILSNTN